MLVTHKADHRLEKGQKTNRPTGLLMQINSGTWSYG